MKKVILCVLALLLVFSGCSEAPSPSPSSVPETPTNAVSVVSKGENEPLVLELPLSQQWTWNDLYDYLENPRQSGTLAFNEDEGEHIALLDTDGKTSLSDQWNLTLQKDMLVIKYNKQGEIIGKYQIQLVGTPFFTPEPSVPSSVPQSSTSNTPAVSTPQTQEKTVVTLYVEGNSDQLSTAVKEFNKQSKTVEILPVILTEEITAQRLEEWANQNSTPDLMILNQTQLTLAAGKGQLYNLSSVSALKKVDKTMKATVTQGKRAYGLPLGAVTACLACNEELLYQAEAGVPTTYEELIENAKQLRDNLTGVIPLGFTTDIADASSMAREFAMFLQSEGGLLFTSDYKITAFYSEAGIRALTHYQTLVEEKLLGEYVVRKDLLGQKIGYGIVTSADYQKVFGKKAKANFTAAPLLFPGSQSASSFMEVYSFCLPAKGDKNARKGALEFLEFLYETPKYSVNLCQEKGWVPAMTKAREDKSYQTDAWQILIDATKNAMTLPPLDCYPTIETYLAECVSTVISGGDKEQALEKAWNKTENRLARE